MNKLRIGLTGNIATGKSAVEKILAEFDDFSVIDGDKISRVVCKINQPAYNQLIDAFGKSILQENLELDRNVLRSFLSDIEKRETLEKIVQGAILEYSENWFEEQTSKYIIFSGSQLIECGYHKTMDKIIVTKSTPEHQLARLMKRDNINEKEAKLRIATQIPSEGKEKLADFIIDNSSDLQSLENQCINIVKKLRNIQI